MKDIFVDSGAFIALADTQDQHHAEAASALDELVSQNGKWITTNYIFNETMTYLRRRAGPHAALVFGEQFRKSARLHQIWVDEALNELVWAFFSKHREHPYSYTDCASFVVMREQGIRTAFAFDRHFAQAGFTVLPDA